MAKKFLFILFSVLFALGSFGIPVLAEEDSSNYPIDQTEIEGAQLISDQWNEKEVDSELFDGIPEISIEESNSGDYGIMLTDDMPTYVYVDGVAGNDANDGLSKESAVSTLRRAITVMSDKGADELHIVNTVTVNESVTVNMGDKSIVREPGCDSDMFKVVNGNSFGLKNCYIDGGSILVKGTVVRVSEGSKFGLLAGAVIANNFTTGNGGAVVLVGEPDLNKSYLYLQSGKIKNCKANGLGGAVFSEYGHLILSEDGQIAHCSARLGGGIYAASNTVIIMSKSSIEYCSSDADGGGLYLSGRNGQCNMTMYDGSISNNIAKGSGAGILSSKSQLLIENGEISSNTADGAGGGILLTDGSVSSIRHSAGQMNANVGKVYITNNKSLASIADCFINGGGIYVDGRTPASDGKVYPVSTLYMGPVLISKNTAGIEGGGIAICPSGTLDMGGTDGASIFGNAINSEAGSCDVISIPNGGETFNGKTWDFNEHDSFVKLPERMLGGQKYQWIDPDGKEINVNNVNEATGKQMLRLKANNSAETSGCSVTSDKSCMEEAGDKYASVIITGNSGAEIGGGIGLNGKLLIEKNTKEVTFSIPVTKVFSADSDDRPEKHVFEITLKCMNGAPMPDGEKSNVISITESKGGTFGPIHVTQPGEYVYVIVETNDGKNGYVYSKEIEFKVVVEEKDGALVVVNNEEVSKGVEIKNEYHVKPAKIQIPVEKTFAEDSYGRPTDESFLFVLSPEDDAPMPEENTVEINGAGKTEFGPITYTKVGTYKYTISESDTGKIGYTYDTTVKHVTVTVTDENAELKAVYDFGEDNPTFVNNYAPKGTSVILPVKKQIKGNERKSEETFEFLLSGEDYEDSVEITGEGTASFAELFYDKAGVYEYEIFEKAGDAVGYTYCKDVYNVMVEVTDEEGKLEATVTYTKNGNKVDSPVFVNTYETPTEDVTTGYGSPIVIWMTLFMTSLIGMVVVLKKKNA